LQTCRKFHDFSRWQHVDADVARDQVVTSQRLQKTNGASDAVLHGKRRIIAYQNNLEALHLQPANVNQPINHKIHRKHQITSLLPDLYRFASRSDVVSVDTNEPLVVDNFEQSFPVTIEDSGV